MEYKRDYFISIFVFIQTFLDFLFWKLSLLIHCVVAFGKYMQIGFPFFTWPEIGPPFRMSACDTWKIYEI
jgi:hypothetical protein